jgi:hypothetical protein
LQIFWETFPGYDPEYLASEFRPHGDIESPEVKQALEPIADLDMNILDQLDQVDEAEFEILFSPEAINQLADELQTEGTVSYDKARQLFPQELSKFMK